MTTQHRIWVVPLLAVTMLLWRGAVSASEPKPDPRQECIKALSGMGDASKMDRPSCILMLQRDVSLVRLEVAARAQDKQGEARQRVDVPTLGLKLPGRAMLATPELADLDVREYLLDAYDAYRNLRRRLKSDELCELPLAQLKEDLNDLLDGQGLRPRLVGVLVPAFGASRVTDGGEPDTEGQGAFVVTFGSRHFSLRDSSITGSLLGKVGFAPIFTMVTPEAEDEPLPKLRNGLLWDIGGRLGFNIEDYGELAVVLRAGQTMFLSDVALIEKGPDGKPVVVGPVSGTGNASFYHEVGARFSVYQDNRASSHELGFLKPLLEVELGERWDDRFRGKDSLKSFGGDLNERYYIRLSLSGLPVFPQQGDVFYLSFGVDHEWSRKEGLPSATKIFLQGNLDLPRVFGKE